MKILAIGAHICDMEFTCGAVLAKHVRLGDEVYILSTTAGEMGCGSADAVEAYKQQKIDEGLRCAQKLGVKESFWLDYPDTEYPCTREAQMELCDIIRRIKPDVVITHWNKARHRDHYNTAINVEKALWLASIRTIKTNHPPHIVKRLFYTDNWEDPKDFVPNVFISVEEEDIERWQAAINEFAVGRGEISGFHFTEYYRHLTYVRGMVSKCNNAQAFYSDMTICTEKLFSNFNPTSI